MAMYKTSRKAQGIKLTRVQAGLVSAFLIGAFVAGSGMLMSNLLGVANTGTSLWNGLMIAAGVFIVSQFIIRGRR